MVPYVKHRICLALGLMMLCNASLVTAATSSLTDDEVNKEWLEAEVQLPAAPKAENLITFYQSGNQTFAIDSQSVNLAGDGTVRYTLIATSNSGVKNISYEAIRCETYEKKLYAFGRPDGSWSRSRRNEWDRITQSGINKQHYVLYTDYFCDGNTIAGKTPVLIDRLHNKRTLY
jgi:hypothetical protein